MPLRYLSWLTSQNKDLPLMFHSMEGAIAKLLGEPAFCALGCLAASQECETHLTDSRAGLCKESGTLGGKALCGQVGEQIGLQRPTGWGQIA